MTTALDDSGINDRLVKMRPLIDQTVLSSLTSEILERYTTKFQRIFIKYLIPQTY